MPGDTVLDPFAGSATTAVEAVRLRRKAISIDINPLSALIGRVKTSSLESSTQRELTRLRESLEAQLTRTMATWEPPPSTLASTKSNLLPPIPNIEKWFQPCVLNELCTVRSLIHVETHHLANDIAQLALSRIIIKVSNQDSETRYVAVRKSIQPRQTIRMYLESLREIVGRLESAASEFQYAETQFIVGDSRRNIGDLIGQHYVDLIVTSPPYPNATDYHLYHRFRLFWLGFDPRDFASAEIGSHLRHQRNGSGMEEYEKDIALILENIQRILMPGRYAAFVLGDAQFSGKIFSTSEALCRVARANGFEILDILDRPIHATKRSFIHAARRARAEQIVILRKPNFAINIRLAPPKYRMWGFEKQLRAEEIHSLTGGDICGEDAADSIERNLRQPELWLARHLTFSAHLDYPETQVQSQPTWQHLLERDESDSARRKESKYVTHGLHPFKGKFYPQLVKSLLNISSASIGGKIFDPYCGSGTTMLEGLLNGYEAYGCDVNPLAVRIASAKTAILFKPRHSVERSIDFLLDRLSRQEADLGRSLDEFPSATHDELLRWFPLSVLYKLNHLLGAIRQDQSKTLVHFFEVILSSLVREVSYQDPTDLRIRRRKTPLINAPVIELFQDRLSVQLNRLRKFWTIAGQQPCQMFAPVVRQGDSRFTETVRALGVDPNSVDCVITSPPYATALPYIDTDRLSLLAILGLSSRNRIDIEQRLTGSREISTRERRKAEDELLDETAFDRLPHEVVKSIRHLYCANRSAEVGFRRANMAALLWRYFSSIKATLAQVYQVLRVEGQAHYVVGDSRTYCRESWFRIETCSSIIRIAEMCGLKHIGSIDIDVTRDNHKHSKNAITKNQVITLQKR